MTIKTYTPRPVQVRAMQYTERTREVLQELSDFVNHDIEISQEIFEEWLDIMLGDPYSDIYIETLEGEMKVSLGDYIICGVQGEFYPCKPDIFEATYDA